MYASVSTSPVRQSCTMHGTSPRSSNAISESSTGADSRCEWSTALAAWLRPPCSPVFDGHNDALTRDDHAGAGRGRRRRPPRPAADAAGRHPRRDLRRSSRSSATRSASRRRRARTGCSSSSTRPPVSHAAGRGYASRGRGPAGRARASRPRADGPQRGDLDAAASPRTVRPWRVLHLEGAEAIDPEPRGA